MAVRILCEDNKIHQSVFYRWKKVLLDKAPESFRPPLRCPRGAQALAKQPMRSSQDTSGMRRRGDGDAICPHCKPPIRAAGLRATREQESREWMLSLLQGNFTVEELAPLLRNILTLREITLVLSCIRDKGLRHRNLGISILAYLKGIPVSVISRFLHLGHSSVDAHIAQLAAKGCEAAVNPASRACAKCDVPEYKQAVFSILHAPPNAFGVNRTTWRLQDIQCIMSKQGLHIGNACISRIIRNAGWRMRKAKTVLTSADPQYLEKVRKITRILSHLGTKDRFFSVDEFGPFAVKMTGGKAFVPEGQVRVVPQFQKSKGSLIVTAALELSQNQVTHFYSRKKDTTEMIKLLDLLLRKYRAANIVYFSWDAASWHASRQFLERVDFVNSAEFRRDRHGPVVKLAPLPAGAQFLNVIESVFSGMAKAILHNSDYRSAEECKEAINRYFRDRNRHFRNNPQRAGGKLWGKELVKPRFDRANNCKDPRWSNRGRVRKM